MHPEPSETNQGPPPSSLPLSELIYIVQAGRIPNALLFYGPRGSGKQQAALFFAQACNCRADNDRPCNICASCKKISAGMHPDMIFLGPAENKKMITISQIRDMGGIIASRTNEAAFRMVCILHADLMNPQAQNALLKMLEEPPGRTFFILAAEQTTPLLPTILSRCRRIDFQALADHEIKKLLCTQYGLDPGTAHILTGTAGSDIDQALRLSGLDKEGTNWKMLRPWLIKEICLFLTAPQHQSAFKSLDLSRLLSARPEYVHDAMAVIRTVFRDFCILKYMPDKIVNLDFLSTFKDISVMHSYSRMLTWMTLFHETEKRLESNSGTRLTLDRFFLSLSLFK
ncbi:DNA polymerase III subunit delta' [Desulfobacter hydrogenophilus]|uniref:DNA polymerase III subunit delta n=1 Tax=Desulfobacter hydrogenophilus TaxID=2291 RepID=A0A328FF08_9BACT|nr:DNA polymerase III subunit delta' [Desulfobacter hydrogenophilus]NDY70892.1 DNA polymerase III subunit delta' [Desulfobacter hydrogenophilus]QBH11661.1 DNA polymerase III subunit delta' [Desulfobacter hydrogenophilus]RAM03208.1 DNA polymerase III subunit delta' [Desulfobacter hydrogenophilus]